MDMNISSPGTYSATAGNSGGAWSMQLAAFRAATGAPDTTPPTTPTGLSATAISGSQVNLSWTASTDNVGVTGYRIYRNGTQIATTAATSYGDSPVAGRPTLTPSLP